MTHTHTHAAYFSLSRPPDQTNVVPGQLEHGYRASIFQFLSLAKLEGFDTYTIISFGQILEECKKNSKVTIDATFFLQMQSSIFGGLLDRLRTTGDQATRALLSALPQTLCQPDLLRIVCGNICFSSRQVGSSRGICND